MSQDNQSTLLEEVFQLPSDHDFDGTVEAIEMLITDAIELRERKC